MVSIGRIPFDKDCICNLCQAKILLLRSVDDVDERRLMIRSNNGFINRTGAKLAYGCDPISFENMTSRRILGMIFLYTINPRVFDFTAQDLFTNIIKEIVIPICLDI